MKMKRAWTSTWLACLALVFNAGRVHAGPIELFNEAVVDPALPQQIIAPFMYGGGGMFISKDGGKRYGLLCSTATDVSLLNANPSIALSGGSLFMGIFGALWRGSKDGCDFAKVPELDGDYVSAVARDPIDPMRTYVTTSNNPSMKGPNGILMNDAAKGMTFIAFGSKGDYLINTLHVAKNGEARRFYQTGVKIGEKEPLYYVRVSDDDGATWTDHEYKLDQFGPKDALAEFAIMAVDPKNPDRLIGRVKRSSMVDTVLYSPMKGQPGSWVQVAEVKAFEAVAFTPDGRMFFGDNDQSSKALLVVEKPGDAPKMLTDTWKVGCLTYDSARERLLGCYDFRFGTVDQTTGALAVELDMRCAERFNECPNKSQEQLHEMCKGQLLQDFCNLSHYPLAPLCDGYDRGADQDSFLRELTFTCEAGKVINKPDTVEQIPVGNGGAAGAPAPVAGSTAAAPAAGSGGRGAAGQSSTPTSGAGGAAAPPSTPPENGGCAVAAGGDNGLSEAFLCLLALGSVRRRRGRA